MRMVLAHDHLQFRRAPLFFFKKMRTNLVSLSCHLPSWLIIGMWFERYVIIIGSLAHEL